MSSRHLQCMSSRRLQRNNFSSSRRLGERKTVTPKTSWRHLEDVFKTSKCFLGINSWKYRDIEETNYFCWKLPNPGQDKYQSPTDLFVLLFNDKILDQVWRETNKYASQKGNYLLNFDKQHLQPFIAVLILSIYIDLLQRPMYWKWQRVLIIALEKIQ